MLRADQLATSVKQNYSQSIQTNHLNKNPSSIMTKMYEYPYLAIHHLLLLLIHRLLIQLKFMHRKWNHFWCRIFKMEWEKDVIVWKDIKMRSKYRRKITVKEWMEYCANLRKIIRPIAWSYKEDWIGKKRERNYLLTRIDLKTLKLINLFKNGKTKMYSIMEMTFINNIKDKNKPTRSTCLKSRRKIRWDREKWKHWKSNKLSITERYLKITYIIRTNKINSWKFKDNMNTIPNFQLWCKKNTIEILLIRNYLSRNRSNTIP